MKSVNEVLVEMSNMEDIKKELKRVASVKSRLKKQIGRADSKMKLAEVEQYENVLKEARGMLDGRKKYVTEYTWEDIETLSYEEVCKAINSIKSKKSLSKWLTEVEGDNDEYRNAVQIESMLYERKSMVEGDRKTLKTELREIVEDSVEMSKEELIERLKQLL